MISPSRTRAAARKQWASPIRPPHGRAGGRTAPSHATRVSTMAEQSSCSRSRSCVLSFKPMSRQADEYIFQRRLVDTNRINLTRKCLDQIGDELVPVSPFDAHAAIQYLRHEVEPFADLLSQWLQLAGLHRNHVAANLLLQLPWRVEGDELAAIENRNPAAPIRFLHQVRGQQNRHAVIVAQSFQVIRQLTPHPRIESCARLVQQ